MRSLDQSAFFRILDGKDYEFLITGFEFSVSESVFFENHAFLSPHKCVFRDCHFKDLHLSKVDIHSSFEFQNCRFNNVLVEFSRVNQIEFKGCVIDSLTFKKNPDLGILKITSSNINKIGISENDQFNLIHLGCDNQLDEVRIRLNGWKNKSDSRLFLCPERFNKILINELNCGDLEIGNFGEYSSLKLINILADKVTLRNCNSKNAEVSFRNVKSRNAKKSLFSIKDSHIGPSILENGFERLFGQLKVENSTVANNPHKSLKESIKSWYFMYSDGHGS